MDVILSEAEGSPVEAGSMLFVPRCILLNSTGDPFDSLRSLRMTFLGSFGFFHAALRIQSPFSDQVSQIRQDLVCAEAS
jgi:hypothetical protein